MREGAKKRLTGAVVVVALAVIFVPMLFEENVPPPMNSALTGAPDFANRFEPALLSAAPDDSSDADLPLMDADLSALESEPPALPIVPELDEPALAPPLAAPGQISQPERTRRVDSTPPPGRLDQSSARPATATKPATPAKPVATTRPATPAKPATTTKPAPPAKTAAPAKPEKPTPSAPPPADGMPTWVVQVASLGSSQAAADLEKRLRGDGFSAFVEKAEVRGKTYYRVRVGPNADRASAEQTADKLRQKQKVDPLVQRYQQ